LLALICTDPEIRFRYSSGLALRRRQHLGEAFEESSPFLKNLNSEMIVSMG
jgi:hypothetical protein